MGYHKPLGLPPLAPAYSLLLWKARRYPEGRGAQSSVLVLEGSNRLSDLPDHCRGPVEKEGSRGWAGSPAALDTCALPTLVPCSHLTVLKPTSLSCPAHATGLEKNYRDGLPKPPIYQLMLLMNEDSGRAEYCPLPRVTHSCNQGGSP